MIFHHQGDVDRDIAPVFEGAFSVSGAIRHVVVCSVYMPVHPLTCGYDHLPHNIDPLLNPVLLRPTSNAWYDPFGVFGWRVNQLNVMMNCRWWHG